MDSTTETGSTPPRRRATLLRVACTGATGRMGREVLQAVAQAKDMALVGAVARGFSGPEGPHGIALESELASQGVGTFSDPGECFRRTKPDVLVDFTSATAAPEFLRLAIESGIRCVSGTTGMSADVLTALGESAEAAGLGLAVIPNFSLGATVLSLLARTAAPYFGAAEIIELHHDGKRDAPSGTALALAKVVGAGLGGSNASAGNPEPRPVQRDQPSRGLAVAGVAVHSVRLSGLVAHHELVFASSGETLTLRHDSISRVSFMPGVLLAVRTVRRFPGLVTSLERLLALGRPDSSGL